MRKNNKPKYQKKVIKISKKKINRLNKLIITSKA